MKSKRIKTLVLSLTVIGVSGLHFATGTAGASALAWHVFFRKLYFVPIVMGAFWFGLYGAMITAVAVIGVYGSHVWLDWSPIQVESIDQIGEMTSFAVLAAVSGTLVVLERLARQKAERIRRNAEQDRIGTAVATLAETLGARDTTTLLHSRRVAKLAEGFGTYLSLPGSVVRSLYLSGILHDIGKIGIRDDVLLKPDTLELNERRKIMEHPRIAEKILAPIGFDKVVRYVATHHENVDGTGYPVGLKQEEIPLAGRILAIVDTYDALSSARPYKAPLSNGRVRKLMDQLAGTRLDVDLLKKFWDYMTTQRRRHREVHSSAPQMKSQWFERRKGTA